MWRLNLYNVRVQCICIKVSGRSSYYYFTYTVYAVPLKKTAVLQLKISQIVFDQLFVIV